MISEFVSLPPRRQAVSWEYVLPPETSSVATARRHVRYALEDHVDPDIVDRAELVVSELVTNAVRHGPGELISLRLLAGPDGSVGGEVLDQGDGDVIIREHVSDLLQEGGRGLLLVNHLTDSWGVHPGSTQVWFHFEA